MVTAYAREQLISEAKEIHFDGILNKPITPSSLQDAISHLHLSSTAERRPASGNTMGHTPYEIAQPIRGARILLVEDNDINQEVATEFLKRAGMAVTVAAHGGEGVDWVRRASFDAVLMDLQMPVMDGFEATRAIRTLPQGRTLPIIAMTAAAMEHDKQACKTAGMNDHVSKPIIPQELLLTLLKWIPPGEREPAPPPITANRQVNATAATLPESLPEFDLAQAEEVVGDRDVLARMINIFAKDYGTAWKIVDDHIQEGRFKEASMLVHRINGASGSIGAMRVKVAAATLENELNAGAPPNGHQEFIASLKAAMSALRDHGLAAPEESEPSTNPGGLDSKTQNSDAPNTNCNLAAIPGLDMAQALLRLGDNKSLLQSMLLRLADRATGIIAAIRKSLADGNEIQAALDLHQLKGSAANLSLVIITDLAAKTEIAVKSKKMHHIPDLLDNLEAAMTTFRQAVPRSTDTPEPPRPSSSRTSPDDHSQMVTLISHLDAGNLAALKIFNELSKQLAETMNSDDFPVLKKSIEFLDFSSALKILRRYMETSR